MTDHKKKTIIAILLAVLAATLYLQTVGFDFVNFDDDQYVYENLDIQEGLTLKGLYTAFFGGKYLWVPLVWVSYMLDFELFGLDPGGYHLTNTLLHAVNSVLIFLVLRRMTATSKRSLWSSAFVGAVFAVHPLHVESVAWVTERKDVLFALFWLLAMWAYLRYVEAPSIRRYLLVFGLFTLSIMSKPMAITLPIALLLLDLWPLGRFNRSAGGAGGAGLRSLIIEKLPLFALSMGGAMVAYLSAQKGGAITAASKLSFMERAMNAPISYVKYIKMTLYPVDLAVFYPLAQTGVEPWKAIVSALVLVVLTAAALLCVRKRPYVTVGWLWFLITLVPVIGIIQSGAQALADRFMYVPIIGLLIIAAWGVPDLLKGLKPRVGLKPMHLFAISAIVITAFTILSLYQIRHWRSTTTLFTHALRVTGENFRAHYNLGVELIDEDRPTEAAAHYLETIRLKPTYAEAYNNLGFALYKLGRHNEAIARFEEAIAIKPGLSDAHYNLGIAYGEIGETDKAFASMKKGMELRALQR